MLAASANSYSAKVPAQPAHNGVKNKHASVTIESHGAWIAPCMAGVGPIQLPMCTSGEKDDIII